MPDADPPLTIHKVSKAKILQSLCKCLQTMKEWSYNERMQLSIYIHLKFLVDLQIFQPKNPPIHMQKTVNILPSHRSRQQELTICIARFLVDLQIFSIASKTQKSSYPLAIPCRFVDFLNMFKNPPIHLQNTVAFLTSNRRGYWELIIYIAQFLVDLQIFPKPSKPKNPPIHWQFLVDLQIFQI